MKRKFLLFDSVLLIFGLFSLVLLPVNVTAYTIDEDDVLTAGYDGNGTNPFPSTIPTQDELENYTTAWTYGAFGIWINQQVYNYQNVNAADIIRQYLTDIGLTDITVSEGEKIEEGGTSTEDLTVVGYDGATLYQSKYGGWKVTEGSNGIDFWMIKAGGNQEGAGFTLWTYGETSTEGYWTTLGIEVGENDNQPELSHFTAYFGTGDNGNGGIQDITIPEPATFMLFGIGLLGLARVSRRKK